MDESLDLSIFYFCINYLSLMGKITLTIEDIEEMVRRVLEESINDSTNASMHAAKVAGNDEFYTKMEDVESELPKYKEYFMGKKIYCPCDGPQSEIFRWFYRNFDKLGLKDLCATSFNMSGRGRLIYVRNGIVKLDKKMEGDGGFESPESNELMKRCDIVVTNPPFTKFRTMIKQCLSYGKKFIMIGNMNESVTNFLFPLMKSGEIHYGYTRQTGFVQPEGDKKKNVHGMTRWFTNLPVNRDNRFNPTMEYEPSAYDIVDKKAEDEGDALFIKSIKDIPRNYDGKMYVPITIFDSYLDPDEYEILGMDRPYVGGKKKFARVLIQKKQEANA